MEKNDLYKFPSLVSKKPSSIVSEKPYIIVSKDKFELNCNGWTLFLALKVLFNEIKKSQRDGYERICKALVGCGAFELEGKK